MPAASCFLYLFATALYFLLREHIGVLYRVMIDAEYIGQEGKIQEHLINLLLRGKETVTPRQVSFTFVGKSSSAHIVGWSILRKKQKPNQVLSLEDLLGEFSALKIGDPKRAGRVVRLLECVPEGPCATRFGVTIAYGYAVANASERVNKNRVCLRAIMFAYSVGAGRGERPSAASALASKVSRE
jgi:hypothetical protein